MSVKNEILFYFELGSISFRVCVVLVIGLVIRISNKLYYYILYTYKINEYKLRKVINPDRAVQKFWVSRVLRSDLTSASCELNLPNPTSESNGPAMRIEFKNY